LYGHHLAIFTVVSKECQAFVKELTNATIPEPIEFYFTATLPPLARLHVEHYKQSDFVANLLRYAHRNNHTLALYNGFTEQLYDFMLDYGAWVINRVLSQGTLMNHENLVDNPKYIDTIIVDKIRADRLQYPNLGAAHGDLALTMISAYSMTSLNNEEYYIRGFFNHMHPDYGHSTASLVKCLRSLIANGVPVRTFRTPYFDGLLESIMEARYISQDTKDALAPLLM
jgi:hypothetical protein